MTKPIKKNHINIRVTPQFKRNVEKLAEADGRSVTNYIETLLKREMDKEKAGQ